MTYFVVFPEGTRFSIKSTDQLVKSQAFAMQNGLHPLTQVLDVARVAPQKGLVLPNHV